MPACDRYVGGGDDAPRITPACRSRSSNNLKVLHNHRKICWVIRMWMLAKFMNHFGVTLTEVDILACLLGMTAVAVDAEILAHTRNQLLVHYMVVVHIVQVHRIPCLCPKKLVKFFSNWQINIMNRIKWSFTDAKALRWARCCHSPCRSTNRNQNYANS